MTSVIHVSQAPAGWKTNDKYVYIGRRNLKLELPQSPFHNPDYLAQEENRDEVCDAFEADFSKNFALQNLALEKLKDKILVCFCKPKRCHGDTLANFVNEE
jgi:Domain of unknown function (DUF4326)